MRLLKHILFGLFITVYSSGLSQSPVDSVYAADPRIQLHDLAAYTAVMIDTTNHINAAQIVSGERDKYFRPLVAADESARPYVTYWLRFSIKPTNHFDGWWLTLCDSAGQPVQSHYADIFSTGDNKKIFHHLRTGAFVPRSQKSIKQIAGISRVLFSARAGEIRTIYIKIYDEFGGTGSKIAIPQLRNPLLGRTSASFGLFFWILSVIAITFSLLSFFFYFFVKERAYLFFAIYTLLLSQHYLILHPAIPFIDWYIPEHPHWALPFFTLLGSGSFIFFLWFGDAFMNLSSLSRRTHIMLKWFLRVLAATVLLESVVMGITHRYFLNPWIFYLSIPIILGFIIRFAFFNNKLARFYVAGGLWLFAFTFLGFMNESMLTLPFNPWPIGQLGQLLIYGAGLAYKIRLNEKARAEAERIQEMDEIKSKFFANISHEFRTPLTLIQGPLHQIEESNQHKDGNALVEVPGRQLKTMRRNTDRLLELVNQLLDLSKLDSGKMQLQVVKGDLIQVLKALSNSFESMAERKQIHYHVHYPDTTIISYFDRDKIEKILTNLLFNAFKFTPEKGTVSVNIEVDDKRLRFSIEDSGPGIGKKELDKVFDRFYQVEGIDDKGSGIGLALVKELTQLYRGQISVSSEPGKGSRFKISLPVDKDSFRAEELLIREEAKEILTMRPFPKGEILQTTNSAGLSPLPLLLIVEDNEELRQFIKDSLQAKYQLLEADNGKDGLQTALEQVPDLIISDVMMPGMDGFMMTAQIKKDEKTSHIPVILLTAKAGQLHKIEGLETGADDYITKPFDAKELLVRIQNLIEQRKLLRKKFAGNIQLRPSEVAAKSIDEIFLNNVMRSIEKNLEEEEFSVEKLAKDVAMSRSQLHRKLIALIDKSPSDLIRQTRLLRAKELLLKKAATPSEVAFKVGFNSHTYFSKCFKDEFGISPSEVNS